MALQYGAILVGAGPAGLAAAARLGKLMKVALVERRKIGWAKPCAGLLCDEAYAELVALGLGDGFSGDPPELDLTVYQADRAAAAQRFRTLDRARLGASLRAILPPSVDVYEDARALLERSPRGFAATIGAIELEAPRLVAADGVGSSARRFLGLDPTSRIGLVQMRYREAPTHARRPEAAMILDPELCEDYYCWVVPSSEWEVAGMKNDEAVIRATLGELRRRFPGRFELEPESIERYQVSKAASEAEIAVTGGGAFLVGEAAGLATPSSGEGLSWAFSSARILAGAIGAAGGDAGGARMGAELEAYRVAMRESVEAIGRDIARGMPFAR